MDSDDPEVQADREERLEETMKSRAWMLKIARDAAIRGDGICGALFALEGLAAGYYLGLDSDSDDSDLEDAAPF